ncbi:hypothetical protein ACFL6X_09830 [Candidatus Latescibacterota bacterium]
MAGVTPSHPACTPKPLIPIKAGPLSPFTAHTASPAADAAQAEALGAGLVVQAQVDDGDEGVAEAEVEVGLVGVLAVGVVPDGGAELAGGPVSLVGDLEVVVALVLRGQSETMGG